MPVLDTWRGDEKPYNVRAFMGWDGLFVADDSVDVLDMLRAYLRRAANESCGQCFPCRTGLKRIAEILERRCRGEDRPHDLSRLRELAGLVSQSARCDVGQTSPRPLLDVLDAAPDLLRARLAPQGTYVAVVTAPCISACPGHVDVPGYLEQIRFRQFDKALQTVRERCPLPGTIGRVCVRPCERHCKRGRVDSPLAIRHLKRFLADEDCAAKPLAVSQSRRPDGKRVAVIGAGPAGLSCAYYLARHGFRVTVFEKQEAAGGMARFGIPSYRLPEAVLAREVAAVQAQGCEIRYGVEVGKDVTLADLERQGHVAVFVGAGAQEPAQLRCAGEDEGYAGFVSGIDYLAETARGRRPVTGTRMVVVGGGNVAMDCVRTARRQGFTDVRLLYRRTLQEMPADCQEIMEAQEEGVVFTFLAAPVKILAGQGKVTGLLCQKMELGAPDESGRRRPAPVADGAFTLACDAVIPAIGQTVAVEVLLKNAGAQLSTWNTLEVDPLTGRAHGLETLFGGGDCVTGPDTLIAALAAGKRAADHIAAQWGGQRADLADVERLRQLLARMGAQAYAKAPQAPARAPELTIRARAPETRLTGFYEVEMGATEAEATTEAQRCLRCCRLAMAAF